MGGGSDSSSSSSGEEDGDAEWRAAIDSIATGTGASLSNRCSSKSKSVDDSNLEKQKKEPQGIKLYQIKARKLLEDFLDRSFVTVKNPIPTLDDGEQANEAGIRLFKKAPPGMVVDPIDEIQQPRKRPRIIPGEEVDEKSKKFRHRLKSVVVDGTSIIAAARDANQKALARFVAKDAAAKAAAKREEERVAELKKIRGEKWLPSIAREMQLLGSHHGAS